MSVVHQMNYLEVQEKSNAIKALEEEKKSIIKKIELLNLDLNVYKAEENLILENHNLGSQQQGVRVDELQKAADFYRLRLSEIKKMQLQSSEQVQELKEKLNKINAQLGELNATREKPTSEIRVTVSAKTPTRAEFSLTFLF
jgi:chaperonin cofactor prefoldin